MKKIDKELLEKFLNSECTEPEKKIVISWFLDSGYDFSLRDTVKDQFYELLNDDELNIRADEIKTLLNKVHHTINIRGLNTDNKQRYFNRFFIKLGKIAAVLILPLLIATWLLTAKYYQQTTGGYVEMVAPSAIKAHFTLPDGTSGWLNSESTLRYKAGMHGPERVVELIGEGFFNVVKNKNKPFIVKSGNIEVKVLGTKFNVNAYPDAGNIEVALQTGKVELLGINNSNEKIPITQLLPGDKVTVSKTNFNNITKTKIEDKRLIAAWTGNVLIFDGEKMDEVAKRLSRWFAVEVVTQGGGLEDYKLHATFQHESLEEILKLIKISSPIDYKIINRQKLADGTYTKEKIILFKKNN